MTLGKRWFLVHAKARQEALAETHLNNQAYVTFFPTELRTVRHARRTRTVSAAYFPGYLFVQLDLDRQTWRPINSTVGVLRLVMANGRPAAAPAGLVERLQKARDANGHIALRADLQPGDRARIRRGPFTDMIGEVSSAPAGDRVRLLLEVMNATVPVEVEMTDCLRVVGVSSLPAGSASDEPARRS